LIGVKRRPRTKRNFGGMLRARVGLAGLAAFSLLLRLAASGGVARSDPSPS